MATAVICDVHGCSREATPAGLRLKDGTTFDLCQQHRSQLSSGAPATSTRSAAGRAPRSGRGPSADGPVRPSTKQSTEEKQRYARAKAWHIARGTIPSSQRGQVSGVQFEEYLAATGDEH